MHQPNTFIPLSMGSAPKRGPWGRHLRDQGHHLWTQVPLGGRAERTHHFLPTLPALAPVPRPTLAPAGSLPCTTGFSKALPGLKGQPRVAPPSHQDSPRPEAPVLLLGCRH